MAVADIPLIPIILLVGVIGGVVLVTIVAALLLVIKFGHPDDKNTALFPKFIVIAGIVVAVSAVLLFSLDVANPVVELQTRPLHPISNPVISAPPARSTWNIFTVGSSSPISSASDVSTVPRSATTLLPLPQMWGVLWALVILLLFAVIPFAILYYEDDSSMISSLFTVVVVDVLIVVALVALYPIMGAALVEHTEVIDQAPIANHFWGTPIHREPIIRTVTAMVPLKMPTFLLSIVTFFGWLLFIVFAPIGFVTMPMSMINTYSTRPMPMAADTFAREKLRLGKRATQLLAKAKPLANNLKWSAHARKQLTLLRIDAYKLQCDRTYLNESHMQRGGSPVYYFGQLILGVLCGLLTISWIVHILFHLIQPCHPMLNSLFVVLGGGAGSRFPLFGVFAFAVHALYLLCVVIHGAFCASIRLPGLTSSIYPMEIGNTYMNAFLANIWIVVAVIAPIIQFCSIAFSEYSDGTVIKELMASHLRQIRWVHYLFDDNLFLWPMLALMILTFLSTLIWPKSAAWYTERNIRRAVRTKHDRPIV